MLTLGKVKATMPLNLLTPWRLPPPSAVACAGRRDRRLAGIELVTREPATQKPCVINSTPVSDLPEKQAQVFYDTYVALLEDRVPFCGGALIGNSTLLTGKPPPRRFAAGCRMAPTTPGWHFACRSKCLPVAWARRRSCTEVLTPRPVGEPQRTRAFTVDAAAWLPAVCSRSLRGPIHD